MSYYISINPWTDDKEGWFMEWIEVEDHGFKQNKDGLFLLINRYSGPNKPSIKLDTKKGVRVFVMNSDGKTTGYYHWKDE